MVGVADWINEPDFDMTVGWKGSGHYVVKCPFRMPFEWKTLDYGPF